jgi:hypothetical protein
MQRSKRWILGRLTRLLIDNLKHARQREALRFVALPTSQCLSDAVEVINVPSCVRRDYGVPNAGERYT